VIFCIFCRDQIGEAVTQGEAADLIIAHQRPTSPFQPMPTGACPDLHATRQRQVPSSNSSTGSE